MASQQKVDLVVVGTHRRHGLDRLRFGSVSRTVLHHANVAVAVIPPAEDRKRLPIPKLDRVLVATDFSDLGNKAVGYGCAILRRGGALKLVHIMDLPAPTERRKTSLVRQGNPKLLSQLRCSCAGGGGGAF